MPDHDFDYIIAGSGAAGLSLLVRMIRSGKFQNSKILLADKSPKNLNDRTWCFWEKGNGFFEDIVYRSWKEIGVYDQHFSCDTDIHPYRYKMIRGIDFYNHCLEIIRAAKNITSIIGEVKNISGSQSGASINVDGQTFSAEYVFNSIRMGSAAKAEGRYNLLQHFKGWIIKTKTPVFDIKRARLMDFRTSQKHGCSFVYVMPLEEDLALVEYTLFTEKLLNDADYDEGLKTYLNDHYPLADYEVVSTESGVIPMTDFVFTPRDGNVINIGTAGGQTKPSTGYTFQFIQKQTAEIVDRLDSSALKISGLPLKYRFYDRVLLNVLSTGKMSGPAIFTRLFDKNPTSRIFRFLDNESSLTDDLRLITSLPTLPFLKAAFE